MRNHFGIVQLQDQFMRVLGEGQGSFYRRLGQFQPQDKPQNQSQPLKHVLGKKSHVGTIQGLKINPRVNSGHQNSSRASKMGSGPPQADQVDLYRGGVDTIVDLGQSARKSAEILFWPYLGHTDSDFRKLGLCFAYFSERNAMVMSILPNS